MMSYIKLDESNNNYVMVVFTHLVSRGASGHRMGVYFNQLINAYSMIWDSLWADKPQMGVCCMVSTL